MPALTLRRPRARARAGMTPATLSAIAVSAIALVPVLGAAPALADGSWFDRLKSMFTSEQVTSLTENQATSGLKEALSVGAQRVIGQVSQAGGYLDDAAIHIPLPGWLGRTQSMLNSAGAGFLLEDVETRLNRAAEAAAPKAVPIFADAIKAMSVQDAIAIVQGPDDAATQYFKRTMTPQLMEAFRPVIKAEMEDAGAIQSFQAAADRFNQIPMVKDLGAGAVDQLIDHGLEGALSGLFHYLAQEEARIRTNPAARTTDILKRVFD
ncbi:MAG: DUF4197 domain-containing protein [Alphaproteobacteria bacterium]